MGAESKGRAWFGKIYNKLETILVEMDTFTSQNTLCLKSSDLPGWESVRSEPKEVAEDSSSRNSSVQKHHDRVDSPSCESPSDPPSLQNFDIARSVQVEERVQGDSLKDDLLVSSLSDEERLSTSPLLEEYCDVNQTSDTSLGDEPIITDEESQISTSSLFEEYSDTNLSSATSLGDEESITTDEESQISTSSLLEEYSDANLQSTTTVTDNKPIFTNDESQIINTLTPQKFSARNTSVSSGEERVEEVRVESCRDVVSIESQPTQSSVEECNDDPVLAALGISTDDSNLNPLTTKTPDVPVQDNVANMRSSNEDNPDDVINGKSDAASLDTNASCGMAFRESPSFVDDSALYALRDRTEKLRSFKRKILDALTSKRRREKEYEQLAIWFGDADMASDLATKEDFKQVEARDSKSSQVPELEDSHWELL